MATMKAEIQAASELVTPLVDGLLEEMAITHAGTIHLRVTGQEARALDVLLAAVRIYSKTVAKYETALQTIEHATALNDMCISRVPLFGYEVYLPRYRNRFHGSGFSIVGALKGLQAQLDAEISGGTQDDAH